MCHKDLRDLGLKMPPEAAVAAVAGQAQQEDIDRQIALALQRQLESLLTDE